MRCCLCHGCCVPILISCHVKRCLWHLQGALHRIYDCVGFDLQLNDTLDQELRHIQSHRGRCCLCGDTFLRLIPASCRYKYQGLSDWLGWWTKQPLQQIYLNPDATERESGYSLDRSPAWHRADAEKQTTTHSYSHHTNNNWEPRQEEHAISIQKGPGEVSSPQC